MVFIESIKMVSPTKWHEAIKSNGFDMELDTDFDVVSHTGFLPCTYKGQLAGFEYYYSDENSDEDFEEEEIYDTKEVDFVGDRNVSITLSTGSRILELMTSVIAAGVLCSITDGVLYDTYAGTYFTAKESIIWAKENEVEIQKEIEASK